MTEEPTIARALEALMVILESEAERLLAVTRVDQLVAPVVDEADSSLVQPTSDEKNNAINDAQQTLREALYHWLEMKDIGTS